MDSGAETLDRLKVAFVTPLNPLQSGISDYSEALVPALAESFDITLYSDCGIPSNEFIRNQFEVYPVPSLLQHHLRYDLRLYQVGNSPHHRNAFAVMRVLPGIVVLHEPFLHHGLYWSSPLQFYRRELFYELGKPDWDYLHSLEELMANDNRERMLATPLIKRIVDSSLGIIVHSLDARRTIKENCGIPDSPRMVPRIAVIPQPVPIPDVPGKLECRDSLGLPREAFIVGMAGIIHPIKEPFLALGAFARLASQLSDARFVFAGDVARETGDLIAIARELRVADKVIVLGRVEPLERFHQVLAACDVFLNLRRTTIGETSAVALQAMALGKPVIVRNIGWFSELPDGTCLKIGSRSRGGGALRNPFLAGGFPGETPALGRKSAALYPEGMRAPQCCQAVCGVPVGSLQQYWGHRSSWEFSMIAVLFILLVCGWTGYGLLCLIGRHHLDIDGPSGLFACILTGVLLLGWAGVLTAELGVFSARALLAAGILIGLGGLLVSRFRRVRLDIRWGKEWQWETLLIGALLVLMGILYFRPHEFIFGGADAGVYVNLGANIANTGSWLIHIPELAAIPQDAYPMFFREHPPSFISRYYYLPGFYISDAGAQTIIPQFYPLHPVWLAVAHGLGGIWANLYMTPLWGMLGVLAFYFAVREAFDRRLAAVAATVLALTPTQIWFARYPTSEVLTQFLLFGGLWAFARYVREGERWAAILAGMALGEVMLARIDAYFLLGVLPVYGAYLRLQRRLDRRFWWFAGPMLAMAVHSLLHARFQGWPYFHNVYLTGHMLTPTRLAWLASALITGGIVYLLADRLFLRPRGPERLARDWKVALHVAAFFLVLLAAYAYFLRPLQADPSRAWPYWYGGNTIPDVEPYNMVRLGWYLSRPGLVLGVLGIAVIVSRRLNERNWMLLGVGLFFSILFIYRTFNNPHHIYVMRRYVPAVIPTFALGIAYAALLPSGWRRVGQVMAAGLAGALALLMMYKSQFVIPQVDYKGAVEQFHRFAERIPRDAIVLFNDDEPVGAAGIFGTPLAFLEGHTVLDLREDRLDPNLLDTIVKGWQTAGRPVVVVEGSSPVNDLRERWELYFVEEYKFNLSVLEHSYDHWPTKSVVYEPVLRIFTVNKVNQSSSGG